jgi:hypothetical protein
LTEKDLGHWRILQRFRQQLEVVFERQPLHATFESPHRELTAPDYLSLFLFGLLNPVAQTLRALSQASQLERVQQEVCTRVVPRASFSEAQHVLDPELLEKVFAKLSAGLPPVQQDARCDQWQWLARDGSLFRALPRMAWALYGGGKKGAPNRAVRLHLSLHVWEDKPVQAAIRVGAQCERAVWQEQLEKGAGYIGDRYFGENYKLFQTLDQKGCAFVLRLREQAVIHVEEELALSAADRAAGVVRQAWAHLGSTPRYRSMRLRVVWIENQGPELILVTNLAPAALPAELVSELYRKRWRIELFFRWIKGHLRIKHYYGTSPNAVKTQIWIAITVYLMVAILHKQLSLPGTLHRTLQLLSVHPFEKAPLHELLTETESKMTPTIDANKLLLLDL